MRRVRTKSVAADSCSAAARAAAAAEAEAAASELLMAIDRVGSGESEGSRCKGSAVVISPSAALGGRFAAASALPELPKGGEKRGGERDSRAVSNANAPLVASTLARGLGGGDSAAPASIASTVALAGSAPPAATASASAAAAATAAEESSERAFIPIVDDAVGLFDFDWEEESSSCDGTPLAQLPCIYFTRLSPGWGR